MHDQMLEYIIVRSHAIISPIDPLNIDSVSSGTWTRCGFDDNGEVDKCVQSWPAPGKPVCNSHRRWQEGGSDKRKNSRFWVRYPRIGSFCFVTLMFDKSGIVEDFFLRTTKSTHPGRFLWPSPYWASLGSTNMGKPSLSESSPTPPCCNYSKWSTRKLVSLRADKHSPFYQSNPTARFEVPLLECWCIR